MGSCCSTNQRPRTCSLNNEALNHAIDHQKLLQTNQLLSESPVFQNSLIFQRPPIYKAYVFPPSSYVRLQSCPTPRSIRFIDLSRSEDRFSRKNKREKLIAMLEESLQQSDARINKTKVLTKKYQYLTEKQTEKTINEESEDNKGSMSKNEEDYRADDFIEKGFYSFENNHSEKNNDYLCNNSGVSKTSGQPPRENNFDGQPLQTNPDDIIHSSENEEGQSFQKNNQNHSGYNSGKRRNDDIFSKTRENENIGQIIHSSENEEGQMSQKNQNYSVYNSGKRQAEEISSKTRENEDRQHFQIVSNENSGRRKPDEKNAGEQILQRNTNNLSYNSGKKKTDEILNSAKTNEHSDSIGHLENNKCTGYDHLKENYLDNCKNNEVSQYSQNQDDANDGKEEILKDNIYVVSRENAERERSQKEDSFVHNHSSKNQKEPSDHQFNKSERDHSQNSYVMSKNYANLAETTSKTTKANSQNTKQKASGVYGLYSHHQNLKDAINQTLQNEIKKRTPLKESSYKKFIKQLKEEPIVSHDDQTSKDNQNTSKNLSHKKTKSVQSSVKKTPCKIQQHSTKKSPFKDPIKLISELKNSQRSSHIKTMHYSINEFMKESNASSGLTQLQAKNKLTPERVKPLFKDLSLVYSHDQNTKKKQEFNKIKSLSHTKSSYYSQLMKNNDMNTPKKSKNFVGSNQKQKNNNDLDDACESKKSKNLERSQQKQKNKNYLDTAYEFRVNDRIFDEISKKSLSNFQPEFEQRDQQTTKEESEFANVDNIYFNKHVFCPYASCEKSQKEGSLSVYDLILKNIKPSKKKT